MTQDKNEAIQMAETLSRKIVRNAPGLNGCALRDALSAFLTWRQSTDLTLPPKAEVADYLAAHIVEQGETVAYTDFAFLQIAAAHLWGSAETSHFGIVLRESRVGPKPAAMNEWERAEQAISCLPDDWRTAMFGHLAVSRECGRKAKRIEIWSASHLTAVAHALKRWKLYCDARGFSAMPTGGRFEGYARGLTERGVSATSAGHYLARIYTGFTAVICPGFQSEACEFVLRDWRDRGAHEGNPTKTGAQLVSGTALYELGFDLMDRARAGRVRGIRAALDFRSGVLLAFGVSLPQRARALSCLEFDRTLQLLDSGSIHVYIPGRFIKQPERRKKAQPYDKVFVNTSLAAALAEYGSDYRPLFDTGKLLFPSLHAPMQGITEKQIGRLTGDLTSRELGVRVSIHRFRDNVATEIGETMPNGGRLAPAVLGHRDLTTAQRHYDHAEGFQVACEFGDLLDQRRSEPTDLLL